MTQQPGKEDFISHRICSNPRVGMQVFFMCLLLLLCSRRKCQKVLGKNMELWENEVYRFKTIGQLKVRLQ